MYRFMILKIYQKFVSGGDGAGVHKHLRAAGETKRHPLANFV